MPAHFFASIFYSFLQLFYRNVQIWHFFKCVALCRWKNMHGFIVAAKLNCAVSMTILIFPSTKKCHPLKLGFVTSNGLKCVIASMIANFLFVQKKWILKNCSVFSRDVHFEFQHFFERAIVETRYFWSVVEINPTVSRLIENIRNGKKEETFRDRDLGQLGQTTTVRRGSRPGGLQPVGAPARDDGPGSRVRVRRRRFVTMATNTQAWSCAREPRLGDTLGTQSGSVESRFRFLPSPLPFNWTTSARTMPSWHNFALV